MKLKSLFTRRQRPRPRLAPLAMHSDWTTGWSSRELADLPPHHPRNRED